MILMRRPLTCVDPQHIDTLERSAMMKARMFGHQVRAGLWVLSGSDTQGCRDDYFKMERVSFEHQSQGPRNNVLPNGCTDPKGTSGKKNNHTLTHRLPGITVVHENTKERFQSNHLTGGPCSSFKLNEYLKSVSSLNVA